MVFSRAELTRSKIPEESAGGTELHKDTPSLSQRARCSAVKASILCCSDAGVAGRIISLFAHDENRRLLIWGRCYNHESLNHQILKSSNLVMNTLSSLVPPRRLSHNQLPSSTHKHAHVAVFLFKKLDAPDEMFHTSIGFSLSAYLEKSLQNFFWKGEDL